MAARQHSANQSGTGTDYLSLDPGFGTNLAIAAVVTGTVTDYDIDYTCLDPAGYASEAAWAAAAGWTQAGSLNALSASASAVFTGAVYGFRVVINAGTGSVALKVAQTSA